MRSARVALVVVLAALGVVAAPRPAHAHGALKSSVPASGARLAMAPRTLRLMFTEAPELAFTSIALRGPSGDAVALGPLAVAPDSRRAVVSAIRGALSAGTYTVLWQMAGADGHPTSGRFTFIIDPGAQGLGRITSAPGGEPGGRVAAPGQTPPPAAHHAAASFPDGGGFGAESPAYVVIRWMQFTALLLVLGALAFNYLVLGFLRREQAPDSPMLAVARDRAARIGMWAAAGVALAALLRLAAQSDAMHGAAGMTDPGLIGSMLGRTLWGWGWLVQAAASIVAIAGFAAARARRTPSALRGASEGVIDSAADDARRKRRGWMIAALGGVALAFTPALSGHAASAPQLTALAVLADGVHVIGAGGWLGSLLYVLAVGIPAALALGETERGSAVADLVSAFSPTALVFAGIVAATGVFAAWLHVGAVPALWQTRYGRVLLLKLGVLSIVAGTGAYNWLRVKPTLGDVEGARRIRRSAMVELAVGVVVLVITAVLVATPTAMDVQAMSTR